MAAQSLTAEAIGFFTNKGLTKAQAAGIVGNLEQESKLNPSEPNGYLAQWLGSRLTGLESFAKGKGLTTASGNAGVQLEYIWQELNTTETGALAGLKVTSTPAQAAQVFSQLYERPSEPNLPARERYAEEAFRGTSTSGIVSTVMAGAEAEIKKKHLPPQEEQEALAAARKAAGETHESGPQIPGITELTKFLEGGVWEDAGQLLLKGVLLLAGAFLVVYGIMVAVRPRDSAMSLPKAMPVPVPV